MQNQANLIIADIAHRWSLLGNGFLESVFMARALLGSPDVKICPVAATIKAQAISIYSKPIAVGICCFSQSSEILPHIVGLQLLCLQWSQLV